MRRQLQKVGNSKALVLSRTMLDHLGVTSIEGKVHVEVTLEKDAIILRAPSTSRRAEPQPFAEALEATLHQYDSAMKRLAE